MMKEENYSGKLAQSVVKQLRSHGRRKSMETRFLARSLGRTPSELSPYLAKLQELNVVEVKDDTVRLVAD